MCPRLSRATKSWPILIPISSKNFSTSTRSTRNAFRHPSYTRRGPAQRRPAHLSKFVCAKGGCARFSRRHFSCRLFYYRQLGVGSCRRNWLALSSLVGISHPHSRATAYEGNTASAEEHAECGLVPGD